MPLLLGPTRPAIEEIRRIRASGVLWRVTVLVAWARTNGVALFLDALGADIGKVRIAVGMAGAGTSAEALSYLRANCAEVHLFHKHHRQTFHPKVYCFEGENGHPRPAHLLVGSSNLTGGGLFSNFEANLSVRLEVATSEEDSVALGSALAAFDEVAGSPYSERITADERIQALLEERYLSTEAGLRRKTREDSTSAARAGGRRGKPEAPPPKLILPALPAATFEFLEHSPIKPSPALALLTTPAAQIAVPQPGNASVAAVGDGRFYVRTLTPNDVAKILGQQSGTFEPDLGVSARSMFPDFWGWPGNFVGVTRKDTRQEWAAAGTAFSSAKPHGVDVEVLQWFRPARAAINPGGKAHAPEHRLRIGPRSVFASALPPEFGVTSLVVVERLPRGVDRSFTIRIIAQGEPGYDDYGHYLTEVRTGHRFGYGLNEVFE